MGFLHISPVEPKAATGLAAEVYRQQAADVGLARMPALMALSSVPALLAATWSLLRESLMAGPLSRTEREVVALGVSTANRCPYCVGAHTLFLHATGDHALAETLLAGGRPADPRQAALYAWATGETRDGPDAPELLGTALAFHFINRMVTALHTPDVLPGGLQKTRLVRRAAGRTLARPARRLLPPGESLRFLHTPHADAPQPRDAPRAAAPAWAHGSPVGTAYAALTEVAGQGGALLTHPERVAEAVARWDGGHPPMGGSWLADALSGLPAAEAAPTRLALLAALAPYRITEGDVAAWPHTDESLVRLLAFGAVTAVRHAERTFSPAAAS
ncbi:carboxymuconolactone decarboxylase family protein [Nonomuraea endophytica]|uniref:AhpD family alkylhydroperoxidase n=1 Tax=Nonomuraea endophytica TaxID=714136 RepID=A0A7W8AFB4_9ACTN|nr:carboxymuconolactone decarboxylase family protein [Nonomuraea endophytica]MBB5084634.1 AhpD family alkylhydroperoxidase [Nonomuraea endophytica]